MSYGKEFRKQILANNQKSAQKPVQNPAQNTSENPEGIPIDGFGQVLEMLKIADPEFRESLLKRLAARDPKLAKLLRADLAASLGH